MPARRLEERRGQKARNAAAGAQPFKFMRPALLRFATQPEWDARPLGARRPAVVRARRRRRPLVARTAGVDMDIAFVLNPDVDAASRRARGNRRSLRMLRHGTLLSRARTDYGT